MINQVKKRLRQWRVTHSSEPSSKAVSEFFNALTDERTAALAWQNFRVLMDQRQAEFAASLSRHLSGEPLSDMLSSLLTPVGNVGFKDGETWLKLYDRAEKQRMHIAPLNYYHPVPDTQALPETIWTRDFTTALRLDAPAQIELLARLASWGGRVGEYSNH